MNVRMIRIQPTDIANACCLVIFLTATFAALY